MAESFGLRLPQLEQFMDESEADVVAYLASPLSTGANRGVPIRWRG
ncbi:MAG: hypothetical protein ACUVS3_11660 [Thermodesulfobacteriota bacterium]